MKKLNMVDKFGFCIDLLNGKAVEGFTRADAEKFLQERQVQAQKKNASTTGKPTKTQVANEAIKEQILAVLTTEPMAVANIMKATGIESNQKTTALLTQLLNVNKVERTEIKGKAHYSLPNV